jgi:lipopolysaccharide export system permease protein
VGKLELCKAGRVLMHKINRYIFSTVFNAIALTLLVFIALFFIFTLIEQLQSVRGDYTALQALINVLLRMPASIYTIIPFACLIGCLAGLGALATSSELVVVRSSGVSTVRIVWMVLRPAIFFIGLLLALGEFVVPYTEQMAVNKKTIALGGQLKQSEKNTWTHEENEFIHFDAVLPNGIVYGLSRYKLNDDRTLANISYAKQAVFQSDHWQEEDVSVTHLDESSTRVEKIPSRRWDTSLTPNLLNVLVLDPNDLSIHNLYYYTNYLRAQNINNNDYALSFWQKILKPLAVASLVLIAISFVFGPLRSVTMGQRVFTGVMFGVAFEIAQKLFGPASLVFGFSPLIAVLLPIGLCIFTGVFLLYRSR